MKRASTLISVIISLAVLYFLFKQITFGDIGLVLKNIKVTFLLAALLVYVVMNFGRTFRFSALLKKKLNFSKLLHITLAHSFLNSILPAKSGELSYLYYLKQDGRVSAGESLASLFVARVFDTVAVIVLILVALVFIGPAIFNVGQVTVLALSGLAATLVVLLVFILFHQRILTALRFFFTLVRLDRLALGSKVLQRLQEAVVEVSRINERSRLTPTIGWTLIIWLLNASHFWLLVLGFGLKMSFIQAVFINGFPALARAIPFYTVGNFGLFEGTTVAGMVLVGFAKTEAISFSVIVHVAQIVISFISGIWSYGLLTRWKYSSSLKN